MVAPVDLRDRVTEYGRQHGHPVADAAGRTGQVHDQGTARHPGYATRKDRRGHPGRRPGRAQRLGDAGNLPLDHAPGHLRGQVARGQPGPAGGHDHVVIRCQGLPQRRLDRVAVGDHPRPVHRAARLSQQRGQHGPRLVLVHPRRGPVRRGDDQRLHYGSVSRSPPGAFKAAPSLVAPPSLLSPVAAGALRLAHLRHGPVLPPSFHSTRTSVITAAGSMALTMSMRASAATDTEVSASISTPVRSAVRATAVMSTPSSVTVRSTVTPCSPIGWHSGIRSGVRLAPAIPAMRATASASPLGTSTARRAATARADSRTRPVAQAERAVTSLPDTSTILAWPALSTCVSPEPAFSLVTAGPAPRRYRPRSSARPTPAPRPARS